MSPEDFQVLRQNEKTKQQQQQNHNNLVSQTTATSM